MATQSSTLAWRILEKPGEIQSIGSDMTEATQHIPLDPEIQYIPQRAGSRDLNRYLCTSVHRSINHNSQKVEKTKCPTEEKINRAQYMLAMEYYSALGSN